MDTKNQSILDEPVPNIGSTILTPSKTTKVKNTKINGKKRLR